MLHTSLLNTTVVAFKVLPLGSYALMPAPSPPFETILELVLWNGLQSCRCITPDIINVIKMPSFQHFRHLREQKKVTGGLDPVNRQGVPSLVAKDSSLLLFFGELLWDPFAHTFLMSRSSVKIFLTVFLSMFTCSAMLLTVSRRFSRKSASHFCNVFFSSACCWPS